MTDITNEIRTTITIDGGLYGDRLVEAVVIGALAVTPDQDLQPGYAITHVPTGRRIGEWHFETEPFAIGAVHRISGLADWASLSINSPPGTLEAVGAAVVRVLDDYCRNLTATQAAECV